MHLFEPGATALLLVTFGVLLGVSVLFSRATERFSVPVALIFLVIGMVAGSGALNLIQFDNFHTAFRIGSVALVLILFDGGLNTPMDAVKRGARPASVLASVGVIGTGLIIAWGARFFGFSWPAALLLGAIVSSTDAAAVFSVLRGSGIHLKRRVGATLELESGINDPMAFMLTILLTQNLVATGSIDFRTVPFTLLLEIAIGAAWGAAIGFGGRALLKRLWLPAGGLYPALTLALAFLSYGVPTLIHGSGFLAVYVAGVILGNGSLPYRAGLFRVHDAVAWLSQITMFLILGLLVTPSALFNAGWAGVGLGIVLGFVARPLMALICLVPFRFPPREIAYVGWVGLRGAVPIVLATYPVLAGAPGAERIFIVVFSIVVLNALVPGATVAFVTRLLGLESRDAPASPAVLAIESRQPLNGELLSFYVDDELVVSGVSLGDLTLPDGASVMLIVRDNSLIPPKESTVLENGDHVHIVALPADRAFIQLLFGRPELE